MRTQYVEDMGTVDIGGGEVATFIRLAGGTCLVLAFDTVCAYSSEEAYWEGEDPIFSHPIPQLPMWTERFQSA